MTTESNHKVPATRDARIALIRKCIREQLGLPEADIAKFETSASFVEYGMDSLDDVELMMGVEDEMEISIPDSDGPFNSIDKILSFLDEHYPIAAAA